MSYFINFIFRRTGPGRQRAAGRAGQGILIQHQHQQLIQQNKISETRPFHLPRVTSSCAHSHSPSHPRPSPSLTPLGRLNRALALARRKAISLEQSCLRNIKTHRSSQKKVMGLAIFLFELPKVSFSRPDISFFGRKEFERLLPHTKSFKSGQLCPTDPLLPKKIYITANPEALKKGPSDWQNLCFRG